MNKQSVSELGSGGDCETGEATGYGQLDLQGAPFILPWASFHMESLGFEDSFTSASFASKSYHYEGTVSVELANNGAKLKCFSGWLLRCRLFCTPANGHLVEDHPSALRTSLNSSNVTTFLGFNCTSSISKIQPIHSFDAAFYNV